MELRKLAFLSLTLSALGSGALAQRIPSSYGSLDGDVVFVPLVPCRIIDTRLAGGPIAGGTERNFRVTGSGFTAQGGAAGSCGVPEDEATAAFVNFVAVNASGAGNLRVTPFGSPMPLAAILNYATVPGLNIANGVAVDICNAPATCTFDFTVRADVSAVHVVADVMGYWKALPPVAGDGSALTNLPPATDVNCAGPCISTGEIEGAAVTSVQIENGTIVNADVSPTAAIAPTKIAGTAATLGANSFVGDQAVVGNLGTSGAISAGSYTLAATTRYLAIPCAAFGPSDHATAYIRCSGQGPVLGAIPGSGPLFDAPVYLPHGATITRVEALVNDGEAAEDLTVFLLRMFDPGGGFFVVTSFTSSGGAGIGTFSSGVLSNFVDNSSGAYNVRAFWTVPAIPGNLGLFLVRITYTVTRLP